MKLTVAIPSAHALGWATPAPHCVWCSAGVVAVDSSFAQAPRFLALFLALSFFRFEGESTLPPTAAIPLASLGDDVASRWLASAGSEFS
jgi:hypothetical protein